MKITKIEGIKNHYGSLHVKEEGGKYYMQVYCELSAPIWREINKNLYKELVVLNKK